MALTPQHGGGEEPGIAAPLGANVTAIQPTLTPLTDIPPGAMLTPRELRQALRISKDTYYSLDLPAIPFGRRVRHNWGQVVEALRRRAK